MDIGTEIVSSPVADSCYVKSQVLKEQRAAVGLFTV